MIHKNTFTRSTIVIRYSLAIGENTVFEFEWIVNYYENIQTNNVKAIVFIERIDNALSCFTKSNTQLNHRFRFLSTKKNSEASLFVDITCCTHLYLSFTTPYKPAQFDWKIANPLWSCGIAHIKQFFYSDVFLEWI